MGFILILLFAFSVSSFSFPKLFFSQLLKTPVYIAEFFGREINALVSYRVNYRKVAVLSRENAVLKKKLLDADEVVYENQRLKRLLTFSKENDFSLLSARVVGRDMANWSNTVVIDKGKDDGIRFGQLVVDSRGLVGKISDVSARASRVVLLTDPNLNIAGIVRRSRESGIVSGSLLGKCVMDYLSADADIERGDVVLTMGLGNKYPKGIVIGEIIDWHKQENGVGYTAIIRPRIKASILEEVMVVEGY